MKAAIIETYGAPEVFRIAEIANPGLSGEEVLIRNATAVATPTDCAFRSADPFIVRLFAGLTRPKQPVLGSTFAGEVVEVGADVTKFKPGQRVLGTLAPGTGAYAEFVSLPESGAVVEMPDEMDFDVAVALTDGLLTAMPFIRDEAGLRAGQKILINGASGSIGAMAVQLAKHFGAEVTGVCSTRNVALVKSLGADHVIDYTIADFAAAQGTYDVIFDAVGKSNFGRCKAALKPNGIYLTTVMTFGILFTMLRSVASGGKRGKLATTGLRPTLNKTRDLGELVDLFKAGKLRPLIDRTYRLERVADAHRYVETGHKVGAVVLTV